MEKATSNLELILKYFPNLSQKQGQQFAALNELYKEWNEKINVISRKDIDGLYEKHVLHSLSIAAAFSFVKNQEVIDIGTGGGFPGIPLAIFFPDTKFHLTDSIGKKIKVVDEVVKAVDLSNITTQHIRSEEIKNKQFDVAVSRAVASLKDLWRWTKPLLRKQNTRSKAESDNSKPIAGGLICLKGGDLNREISESGCRPSIQEISTFFEEPYFQSKYIIQVLLSK